MGLNGGMKNSGGGAARAVATVFFLVVVATAILVPITRDSVPLPGGDDGGTFGGSQSAAPAKVKAAPTPKAWDPRLAPLVPVTARLRGLQFKHPVAVKFLSAAAFEKEIGGTDKPTKEEKASAERTAATLRALGLIDSKVDLVKAFNTTQTSDALAFYDFNRKEIFVRGTTIDTSHKVTLVHEMTHVLQDQYFDLPKLSKRAMDSKTGDSDAFRGLVEGDAERIEHKYLKSLSKADQAAYAKEQAAESARVKTDLKGIPDLLPFLLEAPYAFGPATLTVLDASGGRQAVDNAISGPTPGTSMFLQPGDVRSDTDVKDPKVPSGGKRVDTSELYDAFSVYVTLAMKLDPARALKAADAVTGGRAVTFKRDNTVCYRVKLATRDEVAAGFVRMVIGEWAKQLPTVEVDPDDVGFTACDPGAQAKAPSSKQFDALGSLLGNRNAFTTDLVESEHIAPGLARCVARVFAQVPAVEKLLEANQEPASSQVEEFRTAVQNAAFACRTDENSGLP
jgi:hypothetical protein